MSRHRNAQDTSAVVTRRTAQRKKLEEMGWKIERKGPKGWKLTSPDGKKVKSVKCCLARALNWALALS